MRARPGQATGVNAFILISIRPVQSPGEVLKTHRVIKKMPAGVSAELRLFFSFFFLTLFIKFELTRAKPNKVLNLLMKWRRSSSAICSQGRETELVYWNEIRIVSAVSFRGRHTRSGIDIIYIYLSIVCECELVSIYMAFIKH